MGRNFTAQIMRAAWRRCGGRCEGILADGSRCNAKLTTGHITYDHRNPHAFSRDSSLKNCQVLCDACDDAKTYTRDIPAIAKSNRVLDRHIGAHQSRRPLPCGRRSHLSKPVDGRPKPRLTLREKLLAGGILHPKDFEGTD